MTNVTINIATVSSVLGLGDAAKPLAAHTGYGVDERVAARRVEGAGHPGVSPIIAERCAWRETDESRMR